MMRRCSSSIGSSPFHSHVLTRSSGIMPSKGRPVTIARASVNGQRRLAVGAWRYGLGNELANVVAAVEPLAPGNGCRIDPDEGPRLDGRACAASSPAGALRQAKRRGRGATGLRPGVGAVRPPRRSDFGDSRADS